MRRFARWADRPLANKGLLAMAVPLALLLAALATLVPMERATAEAENEARRTLAVQSDIQSVHAQLAEAATGVRGFLLTGREDFLLRYREVQTTLSVTLGRLHEAVRDEEQKQRLERITPLVRQKMQGLETLRAEGRQLPEELLIERLVAQKKLLDVLRAEIDAMRAREQVLVADTTESARIARQRTLGFVALAGLTGVLAALAAVWLFAANIIRRVQHLRDEAQKLSRAEWLSNPNPSRDELGQLSQSLVEASRLLQQRADETQAARLSAERASAAKSAFLSRTSHELRTPLNAIIGFAQLLDTHADARTQQSAHEILTGGRHLQKLIDELLDLASIEAGALSLAIEVLPLAPLLAESLTLVATARERVQINCPDEAAVLADAQRLRQVLVNLLSNACKYSPAGSRIDVDVEAEPRRWCLSVRDRGPGIAPQLLSRLFTPFDRLGAERSAAQGVGLGLSLSLSLTEAMGGTLETTRREGGGSVFTLRLPRATRPPARATQAPAPAANAPIEAPHRLLCVEDHPGNRALIRALLAAHPRLTLDMTETGAEALLQAEAAAPDAVLLDIHLPDMDGADLLQALRVRQPGLPVIVLTADALPETRARLMAAGATDLLTKPLDVVAFNRVLKLWLP